jgi:hypothetical protein
VVWVVKESTADRVGSKQVATRKSTPQANMYILNGRLV